MTAPPGTVGPRRAVAGVDGARSFGTGRRRRHVRQLRVDSRRPLRRGPRRRGRAPRRPRPRPHPVHRRGLGGVRRGRPARTGSCPSTWPSSRGRRSDMTGRTDEWRVSARARTVGPAFPLPVRSGLVQTRPDGEEVRVRITGRARARPALVTVGVRRRGGRMAALGPLPGPAARARRSALRRGAAQRAARSAAVMATRRPPERNAVVTGRTGAPDGRRAGAGRATARRRGDPCGWCRGREREKSCGTSCSFEVR